jgi:hypothetical protein
LSSVESVRLRFRKVNWPTEWAGSDARNGGPGMTF